MNIAVVGAGIFGVAAAIELRERTHAVTLFEQGQVPYERASSTDTSKTIRRLYGDNATYVDLVERAAVKWRDWANASRRADLCADGAAPDRTGFSPRISHSRQLGVHEDARHDDRDPLDFRRPGALSRSSSIGMGRRACTIPGAGTSRAATRSPGWSGWPARAASSSGRTRRVTDVSEDSTGARVRADGQVAALRLRGGGRRGVDRAACPGGRAAHSPHPPRDGVFQAERPGIAGPGRDAGVGRSTPRRTGGTGTRCGGRAGSRSRTTSAATSSIPMLRGSSRRRSSTRRAAFWPRGSRTSRGRPWWTAGCACTRRRPTVISSSTGRRALGGFSSPAAAAGTASSSAGRSARSSPTRWSTRTGVTVTLFRIGRRFDPEAA